MLVTVNPVPGAYYNIGGSFSCTVEDMLKHLISISTCRDTIRVETEQARLRPLDADLQVPDTTKFRVHTGWQPEISFEKTMQDLLDYWRKRVVAGGRFLTR
jgi:GDPmannose 4,6-dehydratase